MNSATVLSSNMAGFVVIIPALALVNHFVNFFGHRVIDQAADGFDETARRLRDQQVGDPGMDHALTPRVGHRQQAFQCGVDLRIVAGGFEQAHITMTEGIFLKPEDLKAETLIDRMAEVADREGETVPATGFDQLRHEVAKARLQRQGVDSALA